MYQFQIGHNIYLYIHTHIYIYKINRREPKGAVNKITLKYIY